MNYIIILIYLSVPFNDENSIYGIVRHGCPTFYGVFTPMVSFACSPFPPQTSSIMFLSMQSVLPDARNWASTEMMIVVTAYAMIIPFETVFM